MVFRVAGFSGVGGGALGYYGLFVSTANQLNNVANTANLVTLDTTVRSAGISNANGVITFTNAGIYQIMSELSYTSTVGTNPTISTWFYQQGANVPNTTQDFQLLGGANTFQISSCVWMINANAGDTFSVYWSCSNTNVSLAYQAALTNPVRPASPSAIISILQV